MENSIREVFSAENPVRHQQTAGRRAGSSDVFIPDRNYESSPGISGALEAVRSDARVVLISGRAGTGKSKLIDYLRKIPGGDKTVVVAPTGISAMEIDAMTIHRTFALPQGVVNCNDLDTLFDSPMLRGAERIIIDEISMVRADTLDGIDARLRVCRGDDRPFGGVQVVMIGDFLQLPPVTDESSEHIFTHLGYDSPFAISAKCLRGMTVRVAHLTKVWRQTDPRMIDVLSDIREGKHVKEALAWLNERCVGAHRSSALPITLTSTRSVAERYNVEGIEKAEHEAGYASCFVGEKTGVFENMATPLPCPDVLKLCPGARVMAVKNDPGGAYVNGSLGTVLSCHPHIENDVVRVLFDGAEEAVPVGRSIWVKTRQRWCSQEQRILREDCGSYRQIPLVPGYALTIHKSQGLSLDDVRIDLGGGAFAPGQFYVAASRARSVEGLSFAREVRESDVQVNEELLNFLKYTTGPNFPYE